MRSGISLPKRLPLSTIRFGNRWMRIHGRRNRALWFGPASRVPVHRFDDPSGEFRICYFATTIEVCFAETFLRNPPVRILGHEDLAARSVATVEVRRELRLVPLHGPGLARLGITAEVASGSNYALSQALSHELWAHKDKPDGLAYRSRHDDSALCIAIYERAKAALRVVADTALSEDARLLARLLKRYDLGLTKP